MGVKVTIKQNRKEDAMNKVKIYTTPTCPRCQILKNKMKEYDIKFDEVSNLEDLQSLGITTVPYIQIGEELLGFEKANAWINKHQKGL